MGHYLNLAAIVETTKDRSKPLRLGIRSNDGGLWLVISRENKDLAIAPFDPEDADAAAADAARQLTLDGDLPDAMKRRLDF